MDKPPVLRLPEMTGMPVRPVRAMQAAALGGSLTAVKAPSVLASTKVIPQPTARLTTPLALSSHERVMQLPTLQSRPAVYGRIHLLTQLDTRRRITLASEIIGTSRPSPQATPSPAYVVGFGCQPVPASPQPNAQYFWPTP